MFIILSKPKFFAHAVRGLGGRQIKIRRMFPASALPR